MRITVLVAAFAVLTVVLAPRFADRPRAAPQHPLVFVSEFGDPIGQGRTLAFDTVTSSPVGRNAVRVLTGDEGGGRQYELTLRATPGTALRPGVYSVAGPGGPWLHFGGDGRRCDRVDGRFEIESIRFGPGGAVEHLRANFEQRCNGGSATLWGEVTLDEPPGGRQRFKPGTVSGEAAADRG